MSAPALSSPAPATETPPVAGSQPDLLAEVRGVFAQVTRYPDEILEADALLEEDLGVDSVKLGEVFSVLRERYHLPENMGLEPEQLATIAAITDALSGFLGGTPVAATSEPTATKRVPSNGSRSNGSRANGSNGNRANGNGHLAADGIQPLNTAQIESALTSGSFASVAPAAKPLAGKVSLITGSGHGLGKAMASHLAELGATVVVNSFHSRDRGLQTAEEIREAGGDAHHIWGSMAHPEQIDQLFDEVSERYGGLDFFIGNASNGMLARLEDITPAHWEKAFRTNVLGLHSCCLRALELMRRRGGGKIITLSSPAAHGYVDYFGCMGAVKAAVESLTRSMAIEFAPYDVQVNCVSPGPVYGELLDKWPDSERLIPQWEDNTAYHRLCRGDDVAHFVAYLLSDAVKLFTGSVLVMDGGISSQGW